MVVIVKMTKSESVLSVFPSLTHQFNRREDGLAKAKAGPSKRANLPIKVNEREDKVQVTPVQLKGEVHTVLKKTGSNSEVWKTQDVLAHHLNHLHSRLFQIQAKVKKLEVEHTVVMSKVSEIMEGLKEMDL